MKLIIENIVNNYNKFCLNNSNLLKYKFNVNKFWFNTDSYTLIKNIILSIKQNRIATFGQLQYL